ncbi:hypothetical protein LCGC14_2789790, partial [marine sediment metagenome]
MSNKALLGANKADDFQTPSSAVKPLLPYLDKSWIIWECATGKNNITIFLMKQGYQVISSDLISGQDFLEYYPDNHFDCIVTNPPYSLKDAFLKR